MFDPARPYGFEGTTPHIILRGEDGVSLDVAPDQVGTDEVELLSEPLASGTYEMTAAQHECEAACTPGEANTSHRVVISCTRSVEISSGETAAFLVRVQPTGHGGCVIDDA